MTVMVEYVSKKTIGIHTMIIRGFLDSSFSPPAPAVKAFISVEKLNVKGYIKFLFDTGASTTAILDRDSACYPTGSVLKHLTEKFLRTGRR
jgi:hypothetical protein